MQRYYTIIYLQLYSMNSLFSKKTRLAVIGAGAWGTALANLLAKKNFKLNLWVYEKDLCQIIAERRENVRYFPGIKLSNNITPVSDLKKAVKDIKVIIIVVPSQHIRGIFKSISSFIPEDALIVSASKGIENGSLNTISQIYNQELKSLPEENFSVISGPSFAKEIAEEKPSAIVVASRNKKTAQYLQELFVTPYLMLFTCNDVIGVEIGGALKNVIAIAAGIVDGLGYGYNARAALMTRGLAEMMRIGMAMGAKPQTISGLSGMGDLILTSTGELSRNRTIGLRIGKGESVEKIQKDMVSVAEGVATIKSVYGLIKKYDIPAAIFEEAYLVIHKNKNPHQAMLDLMKLQTTEEFLWISPTT